jgi:hypothetical protein
MGTSGDDPGWPARNHGDWDNRHLNLSRGEALRLADRIYRYQVHHRIVSRKEHDMTTQHRQGITKLLIGAAVALGAYVGSAAPVSADPNPSGSAPNPFGGLSCSCRQTAPPGSPALREGIERGIREGRTASLPGPAPSTQPRQSP